PGELALWEKAAGQLPTDLQAGPAYLLGAAWRNLEEPSLAAAWWTRLTVLGRFDWQLAATATREAGDALARIGQSQEAELLWREVVAEFVGTEGAAEAAQRLRRDSKPASGAERRNSSDLNGITP
ncbi:MAG: tetratricopeptide repeat protein, partial [Planctomycetaceae bacterium]